MKRKIQSNTKLETQHIIQKIKKISTVPSQIQIKTVFVIFFIFWQSCSQKEELRVHDSKGVLQYEWFFETDTLTGKKVSYWSNGQVKEIHNFKNGKLNGEYLGYYANGHIARLSHFYNNILRGSALKFFEHADSLVETETYYLDVMGKQYIYYRRDFDKAGALIKDERTLFLDFDCGSDRKTAKVNFADNFPYDSAYFIIGKFSVDFELSETASIDTIRVLQLPASVLLNDNSTINHVVRGKCIFFDGTSQGDSVRIDVKTRYFEERVPAGCGG